MLSPEEEYNRVAQRRQKWVRDKQVNFSMDHIASIDINEVTFARRTHIVCTLGPATQSVDMIKKLIKAGMDIARLNFSHGTHEYHLQSIRNIRKAEAESNLNGRRIAIALDTKGPEIRTGALRKELGDYVKLERGQTVTLTVESKYEEACDNKYIFVTYEKMVELVTTGQMIYIDDGYLCLKVISSPSQTEIRCLIINGGKLSSRKGVNLPGCDVDLPTVSEKDKSDLKFGVANNIDLVFASFIRSADAIKEIRGILGQQGEHIQIIAKLENHQGLTNLDSIISEADGIMVARGDLGIEILPEKVVIAQKKIITCCNIAGKPVICATQMLESMTNNPRATRAEVSDVANAVLDGADCVMLSGETAKGQYPVECVQLMDAISRQAESSIFYRERFRALTSGETLLPQENVTAIAAVEASFKVKAKIIIVLTSTGTSACLLSRYSPKSIIMAVTRLRTTARKLALNRSVHPVLIEDEIVDQAKLHTSSSTDDVKLSRQTHIIQKNMNMDQWLRDIEKRVELAVAVAKSAGYIASGDPMICVTGWRSGSGSTNTMRIMFCT